MFGNESPEESLVVFIKYFGANGLSFPIVIELSVNLLHDSVSDMSGSDIIHLGGTIQCMVSHNAFFPPMQL